MTSQMGETQGQKLPSTRHPLHSQGCRSSLLAAQTSLICEAQRSVLSQASLPRGLLGEYGRRQKETP